MPDDLYASWDARTAGAEQEADWNRGFDAYRAAHPDLAAELARRLAGELPANFPDLAAALIADADAKAETVATRKASQYAIEALAPAIPEMLGGSADLTHSNLTLWKNAPLLSGAGTGRHISYGVREFGMAAIMNGIALHGGYIPFGGTFLTFSDYSRNAIRMAALMNLRVIHVFTHDSIGLGEDGPTHQSVEHVSSLRLIPNLEVWRPCDTVETAVAWKLALESRTAPTALILSRQNLPFVPRSGEQIASIARGGYVLAEADGGAPQRVLIATGSEIGLALAARKILQDEGVPTRVVSLPSTEAFDRQDAAYRASVLPAGGAQDRRRGGHDRAVVEVRRPRRRGGRHRPLRRIGAGHETVRILRLHAGKGRTGRARPLSPPRPGAGRKGRQSIASPHRESVMALVSLKQLLDHAAEHGYGLPAFNVNNMEQIHAIMQAADEVDSPVILQASAGARKYAGEAFLRRLVEAAVEQYPHIPIVMHQDHGASPAVCQASIRSGFTSVMMDGSLREDMKTPASYEYNVEVTRRVVEMAHAVGVSVEGELGCLGSLETGTAGEEDGVGAAGVLDHSQLLTDPEEAADFVARTGVDALAVAIGTSHGAYKFTRPPTGDILDIERIKAIHARIPHTHLVMHGSSSVPQDWLAIIREYGGDISETYGVPVEAIVEGIRHGVRKVNIDTDIRLAMTGAIRRALAVDPGEFDPRKFFKESVAAARGICKARFEAFGSAGRAGAIRPVPLENFARRYAEAA